MASRRRLVLGCFALVLVAAAAWVVLRSDREDGYATRPAARIAGDDEPHVAVALMGRPQQPPSVATDSAPRVEPPSTAAPSGGYVIEGTVRDVATNAPVVGAEVIAWRQIAVAGEDIRYVRWEERAKSDVEGRFRIDLKGSPHAQFEVGGRDWQLIRVHRSAPENAWPKGRDDLTLWVRRAFRIRGIVQDSSRMPLPEVGIAFHVPQITSLGTVLVGTTVQSADGGRFDVGPFAEDPGMGVPAAYEEVEGAAVFVTFTHAGFAPLRIDPRDIAAADRDDFVVTMIAGVTLAGSLVNPRGEPLADVPVVVEYAGGATELRRGVRTDAEGRWRLEKLSPGQATLVARAFAHDAKARRDITLERDDLDVRLVAEAIRLERPHPTTTVLGLGIAEVDDDLRQAYDIPEYVKIVILDPGPDAKRLGIGDLEKGYGIWMVGSKRVTTVREMLDGLLSVPAAARATRGRVRIVYTFWNERMEGTNTQYLSLSPERIEELKAIRARLGPDTAR